MATHSDTTNPDVAQAELFTAQLEVVATQLEQQVTALEKSASMRQAKNQARLLALARERRHELYEVRAYIDRMAAKLLPTVGSDAGHWPR